MSTDLTLNKIREHHRQRRFAMKVQQKLDRALESYVRINFTEWRPDLPEKEREKFNTQVSALIKKARAGEIEALNDTVKRVDDARATFDDMRDGAEKLMKKTVEELPIFEWVEAIPGAGALGLATILAETGSPSNYANVDKFRKRLGYAPYQGFAGSTWRRVTWRPRALEDDEWAEVCFSPSRYAMMTQIATWLRNAQWIGADKTADGKGQPKGHYGEAYAKRRAHTEKTHPDWTDGHRDRDALRIMMKEYLRDLWCAWRDTSGQKFVDAHNVDAGQAAGQDGRDAQAIAARRKNSSGQIAPDTHGSVAGRAAGPASSDTPSRLARRTKTSGQKPPDAQKVRTGRRATKAKQALKPSHTLPKSPAT